MKWRLQLIADYYSKAPLEIMDNLVRQEIEKVDDKITLAAFFFDYMNLLKDDLIKLQVVNKVLTDILQQVKVDSEKMSGELFQLQEKNDELIKMVKKQRAFMNYQRVQVQNSKSVLEIESNLQDNKVNDGE